MVNATILLPLPASRYFRENHLDPPPLPLIPRDPKTRELYPALGDFYK